MIVKGKVTINSNVTYVINKFLDAGFESEYDKSITKYEKQGGELGEVGTVVKYTKNFGGRILIEDREVVESDIPNKITLKITVPGTRVVQSNTFEAKGGETIWNQSNEYKFPFLMHWFVKLFKKTAFEEDLLFQMNRFKDAIEKN